MTTRHAITPQEAGRIAEFVEGFTLPFTLTIKEGKPRTMPQNSLLHKWFSEIARHDGDKSMVDVKGAWHRKAGLAIRMRNPQFAWVWNASGGKLNYEQQCKVLASGVFNISSAMTTKELSEYMDEIYREETARGVLITQPEERG